CGKSPLTYHYGLDSW
nr:immunoglobulin heavy chain junction region [Macaca mulatta]